MRRLLPLLVLLAAGTASAADADIQQAAEAALADVWPDAEVRVVRVSKAAAEAAPIRVRFHEEAPRGRTSAEVETLVDSTWAPVGWAYLDVSVFAEVPVVTDDLDRGDLLDGWLRLERADITTLRDIVDVSVVRQSGWTATRAIRAGTVLTARLAQRPTAIEDGDAIRVSYDRGAVRVTLHCQARERGAIGDIIRAACSDPYGLYRVRVVAPGEGLWTATL